MNDHKNEIGNLFNLLVQVLLYGNNGGSNNNSNGNSSNIGSSPGQAGSLGVGNAANTNVISAALAGLSGSPRASLVGLDLQQSPRRTQQQNSTPTVNRGDV